jgi:two-component system NarL family sensor kinase
VNEHNLFILFSLGTILLTIFAISITVLLLIHKRRQVRHKNELLNIRLQEQEQSMLLISEEIHDSVGQVLSLAKMSLHNIAKHIHDDAGHMLVKRTNELLSTAISDLRHISHSLNSDLIQQKGLSGALEGEIIHLEETTNIFCSFEETGCSFELSKEQNVLAFRIIQEALQNVIKHAEATHLLLSIMYGENTVDISIEDNGKGFDPESSKKNNSIGLRNIRNRAKLLRADLKINSAEGKGTTMKIRIPSQKTQLS